MTRIRYRDTWENGRESRYVVRRSGWTSRGLRAGKLLLDALACIGFGMAFLFFLWAVSGAPTP